MRGQHVEVDGAVPAGVPLDAGALAALEALPASVIGTLGALDVLINNASTFYATPVGKITSGGFGPSLDAPVAMGYVPIGQAAPETRLLGQLRGRFLPVTVAKMPFVRAGYKRA